MYIIDHFDKGIARCEDSKTQKMCTFCRDIFPSDAKEGDAFDIEGGVATKVDIHAVEERIEKKMRRLFKK